MTADGEIGELHAIDWDASRQVLRIIDQRRLPGALAYVDLQSSESVIDAIRTLAIRGANSIGAAGAFGYAFALREGLAEQEARSVVSGARPTAVALRHGVAQAAGAVADGNDGWLDAVRAGIAILEDDRANCRAIGEYGADELAGRNRILTHCNTGILATAGIGTALGVIYTKARRGQPVTVYASETRPLRQGLRLTVWELRRNGIDVTALVDAASAAALHEGLIDAVVVGADRIALNGDTANKIGTFAHALAARDAGVPFYVAATLSAFDPSLADGVGIPIEQRASSEVLDVPGVDPTVPVYNPAFDVTPGRLIAGIITEAGVLRAPYEVSIPRALQAAGIAVDGAGRAGSRDKEA